MKRVVVIPVVHNLSDLGSLAESVRVHYLKHLGPAAWQRREQAVTGLWQAIRGAIDRLELDYSRVRVYQDGLPVCGKEAEILRELAAAGSLNHQLVLELVGKGAILVGTEDPRLLIREYQLQRRLMDTAAAPAGGPAPSPREAGELLAARDRFIAERIAATLQEGETGLVFLGAAHRLDTLRLPAIAVETLNRLE